MNMRKEIPPQMDPNAFSESMPYAIPGILAGEIYGGPFRRYLKGQRRLFGINMAQEIQTEADLRVPTEDFGTPLVLDMETGVLEALTALYNGHDVYVGCMGGTGRTGTFMACMAKVLIDYYASKGATRPDIKKVKADPVKFVRHYYRSHAVETKEQEEFVKNFKTGMFVDWLHSMLKVPEIVKVEVEKIVEVEKVVVQKEYVSVPVYLGPIDWLRYTIFGIEPDMPVYQSHPAAKKPPEVS